MKYRVIKPPAILENIVHHYWTLEGTIPTSEEYLHRTLANSHPELIFHYGGTFKELITDKKTKETFITGIHGQTDKTRLFIAKKSYGIFGVVLQPYAIPVLLRISSLEIKNELADLESLMGQSAKDLSEQILLAHDTQERLKLMHRFLIKRITEFKRPEIVYAAQLIYKMKGVINVNELSRNSCLSLRQFERKFIEHIGFSPTSFAKLVRFKSIVGSYKKEDSALTKVAYDFGYYDQSHFIHDFKKFSGYSPNIYFSGRVKDVFYAP